MKYALMAALIFCVALPPALRAQAKTDFSGTWTFDEAKSDPEKVKTAPHTMPVKRLNEVKAAKEPVVRCFNCG